MTKTFIIAEAGSNHDGSLKQAKDLVDIARDCGANAVKFQFWSSSERMAERRHAPETIEIFRKYRMPEWWLLQLYDYCGHTIEFMCTCYLSEDIEKIAPFVQRFKVGSFEANDRRFLQDHLPYKKEILVSTGGKTGLDVKRISSWFAFGRRPFFLHCVSSYPCPDDQINIAILQYYNGSYFSGLSDHTKNPLTGALAVAYGVKYIETHFRDIDTSSNCPDYTVSRNPFELKEYIHNIRQAEILLGESIKKIQPCEEPYLKYRVENG